MYVCIERLSIYTKKEIQLYCQKRTRKQADKRERNKQNEVTSQRQTPVHLVLTIRHTLTQHLP